MFFLIRGSTNDIWKQILNHKKEDSDIEQPIGGDIMVFCGQTIDLN